ncbi:MAG TPA: RidA family protein [Candidatus Thermoplasmatota archaeon]|jgi:enamine deaminase RidA (YjgF/YER057c/UK114 family)|nr:RidA family protein [Candidatus Thermoplasmatota archaeon]
MAKPGPVEARLQELGITLPSAPKPAAAYVPSVRVGELLFVSGVGPTVDGKPRYTGQVPKDLSIEQGQDAARICAMNLLAIARDAAGLERIVRVVKLVGFVNSVPGFAEQHKVVNGASEFMVQVLGDRGKHARSAIGVQGLPLDFAVEVEAVFQLDQGPYGIH